MLAKIMISGKIISKTGMHIGGASGFSAIGAIDSPVVRDIQTDEPMIPGSRHIGITSKFGHDGFLLENDLLTEIISPILG